MNKTISVVIPAYNEGEYIKELINAVTQAQNVSEIILVDDKSKPEFSKMYDTLQGVKVIHKEVNQGKDMALKTGIENAKSDYILILDGDLKNLRKEQIEYLNKYIELKKDIVCIIRGKDLLIAKIFGLTYLMLGEHLLSRRIIMENFDTLFNGNAWNFDNEINNIALKVPREQVSYVEFSGIEHQLKSKKHNFWYGLKSDIKMIYDVIIKKYKIHQFLTIRIKLFPLLKQRDVI